MTYFRNSPRSTLLKLALLLCCLTLPGCVRRRMLIRSNPPGAMVYVDNQAIGTTPCATNFTYYGTREVRLVKPGYETLTINQPMPAPWYEIPPLDFISENLVPREIQDYRTLAYNMQPQVVVPTEQLLGRAQQLRESSQPNVVLPAGAVVPGAPPGAVPIGSPTFAAPPLGAPVMPPNGGPELFVPPSSGAGQLPAGGTPLETLPPPR